MNDRFDERHDEVMEALNQLAKTHLLDVLHRLERLESQDASLLETRLPSIETAEEREHVIVDVSERLSVLEARMEEE